MRNIFSVLGNAFASFRDMITESERLPKNEIDAYRVRIRNHRRAVYIRAALIVVVLLAAAVIAYRVYERRSYDSYEIISEETSADNISNYCYVKGRILRYSADGAALLKSDLESVWYVSYNMTQPCVSTFGKTILIYDRRGSEVQVYDEDGRVGSFATEMPILYACCSKNGNVACVLESGSGMEIAYYSAEGTRIATLSKSAEETGFPVCMALSENGKQLAVSYVTAVNGAVSTNLIFYSFRNPESADKVIADLSYSGIVIPDIRYISDTVAAVFRDNGVSFFGGNGKPVENASVDFDDEIISTFTGDGFAGFIVRNRNSTNPYRMEIYSGNGKLISRTDMEFVYDRISVCGNEILLSSSSELAIYTKKGICRFYGGIDEGNLSGIQKIGRKRYLVVTDMSTKVIELD